jgi:hypothetical protein
MDSELRVHAARIEDAPGTEWFMTSKDEILSIIRFLNIPPDPEAPSNNGVETDA